MDEPVGGVNIYTGEMITPEDYLEPQVENGTEVLSTENALSKGEKKQRVEARTKNLCASEKDPIKKMKNAIADIIRVDDIRIIEIVELMYYSFFYTVLGLFTGTGVNRIFPARSLTESPSWQVFIETIIQVMIISLVVFYIKKIVKIIPSPFTYVSNYCPYIFTETVSIVILGVVIISTQSSLVNKFEILGNRFGVNQPTPFVERLVEGV